MATEVERKINPLTRKDFENFVTRLKYSSVAHSIPILKKLKHFQGSKSLGMGLFEYNPLTDISNVDIMHEYRIVQPLFWCV